MNTRISQPHPHQHHQHHSSLSGPIAYSPYTRPITYSNTPSSATMHLSISNRPASSQPVPSSPSAMQTHHYHHHHHYHLHVPSTTPTSSIPATFNHSSNVQPSTAVASRIN